MRLGENIIRDLTLLFFLDFLLFDRRYDYFIFVFFFFYEAVILKQRWIEKNISYDEDYFLSIFFF